jgi:hypothetical protein
MQHAVALQIAYELAAAAQKAKILDSLDRTADIPVRPDHGVPLVDGTLRATRCPSPVRRTRPVKVPPTSTPRRHASSSFMVSRLDEFDIDFRFEHTALLEVTICYLVIGAEDAFSISEQVDLRADGAGLLSGGSRDR